MKMKAFICALFVSFLSSAVAQTDTASTYGCKHTMTAGLNLSQISFTNWSGGGDNSLSWVVSLDGKSVRDEATTNWASTYKFAFGQARISDAGLRKTDDRIELESILTYKLNQYVNPYAGITFKSQFATGFKYNTPVPGQDQRVSAFFDPAYLTQSAGAGWQATKEVKTRLGLALREIFSAKYGYADDAATAAVEKSTVEGGIESTTDVDWKVAENILFTSKLELFATFKAFDRVSIRSDNKLTMTVNKYLSAIMAVQFLNLNTEQFPRTQIKELIAIGLTYNVF
jgi:hypothetical protein